MLKIWSLGLLALTLFVWSSPAQARPSADEGVSMNRLEHRHHNGRGHGWGKRHAVVRPVERVRYVQVRPRTVVVQRRTVVYQRVPQPQPGLSVRLDLPIRVVQPARTTVRVRM